MRRLTWISMAVFLCAAIGCATAPPPVLEPPTYELRSYPAVGLIQFDVQPSNPALGQFATEQFLRALQKAQPGVRVVELGPESQLLASVGATTLNRQALVDIGEKNQLPVLFVGSVALTKPQTKVNVGALFGGGSLGVKEQVTQILTARLFDTASGATVWEDSLRNAATTGGVELSSGEISAGGRSANDAYHRMLAHSIYRIADPFRSHWVQP